jgi:hypothetical protein
MSTPSLHIDSFGPAINRSKAGLDYETWIKTVREQLAGMDQKSKERAKKANQDFARGLRDPKYSASYQADLAKAITPTAVHVDTVLTTLSVMYKNDEYIGERLMPAVPIEKRSGVFYTYNKRDRLAAPDDEIGHRASPNEIEENRSTDNYSVRDYGLKNFLDLMASQNADAPLDEMVDVVEAVNERMAFRREKRILAIVGVAGSYGSNTTTAATDWDDGTDLGGTIVTDILAADSALWNGMAPTRKIGFCGVDVWNGGIANNPKIAERFKYVETGLQNTTQVARMLGLDDILVSRAREDTANIGQTASYARMMPAAIFGILRVAARPSIRSAHFGSTFRLRSDPFTSQWTDPSIGAHGGIWARVTVSEDHKVVASDAGYLLTSVI